MSILDIFTKEKYYVEKFNELRDKDRAKTINWLVKRNVGFKFHTWTGFSNEKGYLGNIRMDQKTLDDFKANLPNIQLKRYISLGEGEVARGVGEDLEGFVRA